MSYGTNLYTVDIERLQTMCSLPVEQCRLWHNSGCGILCLVSSILWLHRGGLRAGVRGRVALCGR